MFKTKKVSLFMGIIIALLTGILIAGDKTPERFENFTLKDYNGFEHSLYEYKKDAKAIVVMFIATRCPISNAYNERMVQLVDDYEDKGVVFVGINSNKQEDIEDRLTALNNGWSEVNRKRAERIKERKAVTNA